MIDDLLLEPLGLLHGSAAREAIDRSIALPLAGGPSAFTAARQIGPGGSTIVPASELSAIEPDRVARVTEAADPAGLPSGALVMGILNVTPDSFSDGGRHFETGRAIEAGIAMAEAGAAIIDVGGESTRPGAQLVSAAEEQARIVPVVAALARNGLRVSLDTRNASTMRAGLEAGACLVNDVSALAHDPEARAVVAETDCSVVLMHMRGTPETMGHHARYDDVAVDVVRELAQAVDAAVAAGIARSRILIDPGLGFAKTAEHNLSVLARLPLLLTLGCRVMLGASRKRFIGEIGGAPVPAARDPGSIAVALAGLVLPDVVLRVHDVPGTVQAVRLWQAIHR